MKKLVFGLLFTMSMNLFANPLIVPPVISEFSFEGNNWQMEIYFDSEILSMTLPYLENFDSLCLECNQGSVFFNSGIPFTYDSLYVIDQTWLKTDFPFNPITDRINIQYNDFEFSDYIFYEEGSINYPPPGPGESIAIQYVYVIGSSWPENYIQMIQSPPTMGSEPFNVVPNASFSGYVFDQFQNPLEGVELVYCDISYCNGYSTPVFPCLQTDEAGYFECDSLFPMFHRFDINYDGYIYQQDILFIFPNQPEYREYTLLSVGTEDDVLKAETDIIAYPNPFNDRTTFNVNIPPGVHNSIARITIRDIHGSIVDYVHIPLNPWAGGEINVDWHPDALIGPGLYIYTLELDGRPVKSEKLIINE